MPHRDWGGGMRRVRRRSGRGRWRSGAASSHRQQGRFDRQLLVVAPVIGFYVAGRVNDHPKDWPFGLCLGRGTRDIQRFDRILWPDRILDGGKKVVGTTSGPVLFVVTVRGFPIEEFGKGDDLIFIVGWVVLGIPKR